MVFVFFFQKIAQTATFALPLKNLEDYLQSQPPLVSAAAYCRSPYCFLAREAQRIFAAHGRRLLVVEDGMLDWKAGQSQKIVK